MTEQDHVFEPLGNHDRAAFSCGETELDSYFRQRVRQDQRRGVTRCTVLVDVEANRIAGFHTLSMASIALHDLPADLARRLPRYPEVPAVVLGRMAVDLRNQGQGIGRALLMDAMRRVAAAAEQIGAVVMLVDAKNPVVVGFYAQYGFAALDGHPLRLFLPLDAIRAML